MPFLPQHVNVWILRFLFFATCTFIVFIHICLMMPGVDASIEMYGALLINKGFEPHQHILNNKPTLIYIIGALGFFIKSNPFLGVRIIELIVLLADLWLIYRIAKIARLRNPLMYLISFCAIYLVCWDMGFLTETFTIPFALLAVYLFLEKSRYFEYIATLLLVLSFLLKQNAIAVIGGIMVIDVFGNYRNKKLPQQLVKYLLSLVVYLVAVYMILKSVGGWKDFLYQVFIYNSKYADRSPLFRSIVDHIRHNSFLSVKGISVVMIFNACLLFDLWKYFKQYRQRQPFGFEDRFYVNAIVIYSVAYVLTYISGKSHPHYFMLAIVPATFLMGRYVSASVFGKLALMLLLAFGIYTNFRALSYNKDQYASGKEIAAWLQKNTTANEPIHIIGLGKQYIYVMADRLSHTRYIIPIFEIHGYQPADKALLTRDFTERLPRYMVVSRGITYRPPDLSNFYLQVAHQALSNYHVAFQNEKYSVYQLNGATISPASFR